MKKASSVQMVHNVGEGGRFAWQKEAYADSVWGEARVGERRWIVLRSEERTSIEHVD